MHEWPFFAGHQPSRNGKHDAYELADERAYGEQALDVHAVEVGLDLGDAAASCQGFHIGHQGTCHKRIAGGDADKRKKWPKKIAWGAS